jgi:hypothetical protein
MGNGCQHDIIFLGQGYFLLFWFFFGASKVEQESETHDVDGLGDGIYFSKKNQFCNRSASCQPNQGLLPSNRTSGRLIL